MAGRCGPHVNTLSGGPYCASPSLGSRHWASSLQLSEEQKYCAVSASVQWVCGEGVEGPIRNVGSRRVSDLEPEMAGSREEGR